MAKARALDRMYPIVIFDALRVKIRDSDSRPVKNKAVLCGPGRHRNGSREVAGCGLQRTGRRSSGSRYERTQEPRLQDVLIAVALGLKGFADAITAAVPEAMVQPGLRPSGLKRSTGSFPRRL
jgi:putative transposase